MSTEPQSEAPAVDAQSPLPVNRKPDPQLSAREKLMADMDARIDTERKEEYERWLTSNTDPRARAMAAAMQKEAKGEALDVDRGHRNLTEMGGEEAEPTRVEDGAASVEKFEEPAAKPAQRVSQKGEDPLGKYVVRVDGKPMFKMQVDGKETLIDLDRAHTELQKHEAANVRLMRAAEQKKQLDAREAALRAAETKKAHPSAPKAPAVNDLELARGLIRSLESEPAEKAAVKMAEAFGKIRAAQPQVDLAEVRRLSAAEARQAVAEERTRAAFDTGFSQFQNDYPEIAKDSDLFALADKKSETIGQEHPDWTPGQVMNEAGRQTREWMKTMGFKAEAPTVDPTPPASRDPKRQQRKEGLVPIPTTSSARRESMPIEDDEDSSPAATLAAIRKQRGQPS